MAQITSRRVDIRAILEDPKLRRDLMVDCLIATQGREGRELSRAEAEEVVDRVTAEVRNRLNITWPGCKCCK